MPKYDLHTKLDGDLAEAIRRYAAANSLPSFTAALSFLARRGLTAEGITTTGDDSGELLPQQRGPVRTEVRARVACR